MPQTPPQQQSLARDLAGARAVPVTDLAGSVRQSLGELARISESMDAGTVPGEATAMRLVSLAAELREAAAAITSGRRPDEDPTAMIRGFLAAAVEALDIPRPASADDERAYFRTRSLRADEVIRAARTIMESADDPIGRNWAWAGAWLKVAASDHGTSGYVHADPGAGMIA